jgi:hypothetical protein
VTGLKPAATEFVSHDNRGKKSKDIFQDFFSSPPQSPITVVECIRRRRGSSRNDRDRFEKSPLYLGFPDFVIHTFLI